MKSSRAAATVVLRLVSIACLIAASLSGRAPARDSSSDDAEASFKALLIDGRETTGRIVSFGDAQVTIATNDGKKEGLPLDRLVKLTRESPGAIVVGESSQVVLLGEGDRLMRSSI